MAIETEGTKVWDLTDIGELESELTFAKEREVGLMTAQIENLMGPNVPATEIGLTDSIDDAREVQNKIMQQIEKLGGPSVEEYRAALEHDETRLLEQYYEEHPEVKAWQDAQLEQMMNGPENPSPALEAFDPETGNRNTGEPAKTVEQAKTTAGTPKTTADTKELTAMQEELATMRQQYRDSQELAHYDGPQVNKAQLEAMEEQVELAAQAQRAEVAKTQTVNEQAPASSKIENPTDKAFTAAIDRINDMHAKEGRDFLEEAGISDEQWKSMNGTSQGQREKMATAIELFEEKGKLTAQEIESIQNGELTRKDVKAPQAQQKQTDGPDLSNTMNFMGNYQEHAGAADYGHAAANAVDNAKEKVVNKAKAAGNKAMEVEGSLRQVHSDALDKAAAIGKGLGNFAKELTPFGGNKEQEMASLSLNQPIKAENVKGSTPDAPSTSAPKPKTGNTLNI